MPDIAPVALPVQPAAAPSPPPKSPATGGSESSFESILAQTNASQNTPQRPAAANGPAGRSGQTDPAASARNIGEQSTIEDVIPDPMVAANGSVSAANSMAAALPPAIPNTATVEQQAFTTMLLDSLTGSQQGKEQDATGLDQLKNEGLRFLQGPRLPDTARLSNATVSQVDQPLLNAQLEKLIAANETKTVTITRQPAEEQSLASLRNLTQPVLLTENVDKAMAATPVSQQAARETTITVQSVPQLLTQTATAEKPEVTQQVAVKQAEAIATLEVGKSGLVKAVTVQEVPPPTQPASDNQPSHLRQDVTGNYLEAKLQTSANSNNANDATTDEQGARQDLAAQQQTSAKPGQQSVTSETSQSYAQVSQGVLDTPAARVTHASQATTPFPGSMVSDEAIVQQVAQKFNLQLRNQETQINIKLHPAQLGELKIDLTYREGAIRANVVAQSQHVQEILEKNMPRLRDMLQSQGIQIEEIQVSAKSDFVGDFDMLQEQFARSNDRARSGSNRMDSHNFNETLEAVNAVADTGHQGVNLTI